MCTTTNCKKQAVILKLKDGAVKPLCIDCYEKQFVKKFRVQETPEPLLWNIMNGGNKRSIERGA